MALAELLSASAGAWIVWPGIGKRLLEPVQLFLHQDAHYLVGVASAAQQLCHEAHGVIDVVEEQLVPGA